MYDPEGVEDQRIAAHLYYARVLDEAKKKKILKEVVRRLIRTDRFYLLVYVLGRKDADNNWAFARCREVEADPHNRLDLWFREGYKSTIITYCGTIQQICINPEITICIFSYIRPIAKSFLVMIKGELERNEILKWAFDDIFWSDPIKESRKYKFKWSEDEGLTVKRATNPNEKTLEAWGLVDGQPTSKHFMLRIYNDVVTDKSTTDEMIKKTTAGWQLSHNLGRRGGWQWYEGTIYHHADTYKTIMDSGIVKPRVYPATIDGTLTGKSWYLTPDELASKRTLMGSRVFAMQMLLNPSLSTKMGFDRSMVRFWNNDTLNNLNIVMIVDPASKKKKRSDYTVFWLIGLGPDKNYYVIDLIRDKLSLSERTRMLFMLHQKYSPMAVAYEEYGAQSDVEHYEIEMARMNYRFHITRVGGTMAKEDRIQALEPDFEQGRFYFPRNSYHETYEGKSVDTIDQFINDEFVVFPFGEHDDMLDSLARLKDPKLFISFPEGNMPEQIKPINQTALEQDESEFALFQ